MKILNQTGDNLVQFEKGKTFLLVTPAIEDGKLQYRLLVGTEVVGRYENKGMADIQVNKINSYDGEVYAVGN